MSFNKKFVIVPIIVIIYLILIIGSDIQKIFQNIVEIQIDYFIIFIMFFVTSIIPRIVRWHFFMNRVSSLIPFKKNILYFLSGFALLLTPGRIGEIIRSPFIKRDYGIPISKSASIVFVERFYDLLAVVMIITITLPFTQIPKIILIFPVTITLILIFLIIKKKFLISFTNKLRRINFLSKIIPNIEESFEVIDTLLRLKFIMIGLSLSFFTVILEALGVFYLLESLNTPLDFFTLTAVFHTANFAAAASMIPGGFGILEGGFAGLLILYNVPNDVAFSASLLIRIIATGLFSLIGIFCLKLISKNKMKPNSI